MRKESQIPGWVSQTASGWAISKVQEWARNFVARTQRELKEGEHEVSHFNLRWDFNRLANMLKMMGSTDPTLTNPIELEHWVQKHPELIRTNEKKFHSLLTTLSELIASGSYIKTFYPQFADQSIKYALDIAKNGSIDQTIAKLQELIKKAQDEEQKYGKYIEHIINKRYPEAILTLMLLNLSKGTVNQQDIAKLKNELQDVLGPASVKLLNARMVEDAKAYKTLQTIALSDATYDLWMPSFIKSQLGLAGASEFLKGVAEGPLGQRLANHPTFERIMFIMGLPEVIGGLGWRALNEKGVAR